MNLNRVIDILASDAMRNMALILIALALWISNWKSRDIGVTLGYSVETSLEEISDRLSEIEQAISRR
jgi:hypothetical protein